MRKDFNKEIKKWDIYFLEERFDNAGNRRTPYIKRAWGIETVRDYNHFEYELHHVIPFTDWEKNTKGVREKVGGKNVLILLPKVMHQHLENPIYKLSKEDFERVYKIHPDEILYDINSKIPRERELFINTLGKGQNFRLCFNAAPIFFKEEDLSCFLG